MLKTQRLTGRVDPYNAEDRSPFTSNAIKSSCWELATLQTHYLSSVSIMAKIFTEVFTKPEFNMEDFMDHGYGTVSFRHFTGCDRILPLSCVVV